MRWTLRPFSSAGEPMMKRLALVYLAVIAALTIGVLAMAYRAHGMDANGNAILSQQTARDGCR